ncbi:MAG: hypothetical protein AB1391_04205 [Candidatus Micrarchaeota archaeon]
MTKKIPKSRMYSTRQDFSKKVVYSDRPIYEKRSNDLAKESWSYHSLFPSLRTFIPLFALPISTIPVSWLVPQIDRVLINVLWSLFNVAICLAIIFFFVETTKYRASHAVKDGLINITIFILLLFFNLSRSGIEPIIEVFLLYLGGHMLLHAVDFHVERAKNRANTNLTVGGFLVCIELFLAISFFSQL